MQTHPTAASPSVTPRKLGAARAWLAVPALAAVALGWSALQDSNVVQARLDIGFATRPGAAGADPFFSAWDEGASRVQRKAALRDELMRLVPHSERVRWAHIPMEVDEHGQRAETAVRDFLLEQLATINAVLEDEIEISLVGGTTAAPAAVQYAYYDSTRVCVHVYMLATKPTGSPSAPAPWVLTSPTGEFPATKLFAEISWPTPLD